MGGVASGIAQGYELVHHMHDLFVISIMDSLDGS